MHRRRCAESCADRARERPYVKDFFSFGARPPLFNRREIAATPAPVRYRPLEGR
jgi:hypothetical protein